MCVTLALAERVYRRLAVPCTPTELAAILKRPVKIIRSTLFDLKDQGRVARMDRTVKREHVRGPAEFLWERRQKRLTLSMKHKLATDALLRILCAGQHVGSLADGGVCDRYEQCPLCIAADSIRVGAIRNPGGRRRRIGGRAPQ